MKVSSLPLLGLEYFHEYLDRYSAREQMRRGFRGCARSVPAANNLFGLGPSSWRPQRQLPKCASGATRRRGGARQQCQNLFPVRFPPPGAEVCDVRQFAVGAR